MSTIRILLAAEAAAANRAVPSTAYLHRHLAQRPLVVSAYNLSGEAAAPLGFCFGTDAKKPIVVVAPEPRNRESRFAAINAFAKALVDYINPFLVLEEREVGHQRTLMRVATNAPQIVTPNRGTRDFIGARLGRSLRYLGLGDTHEVPEATQWAGAHLSWLAEHALFPGQSVFLAATEILNRHFVTGQSDLENENLASLLAWIENDPKRGRARIDAAEAAALGPVPDPEWEQELEPMVRAWTSANRAGDAAGVARAAASVKSLVEPRLIEGYQATWRALSVARGFSPAASVAKRWDTDVRHWGSHAWRCQRSIPRFGKRHDPLRAARMLEEWSRALEHLNYEEALDDPMVLAEHDAAGRCLCGKVRSVKIDNHEIKPGNKRKTMVPLVELELGGSTNLIDEDRVIWTAQPSVAGEIRDNKGRIATVAVMGGHKYGTVLPAQGSSVVFAALSVFDGRPPDDPLAVPWTHRAGDADASEMKPGSAAARAAAADDGTPDLSPDQLLELPVLGPIDADDVPGVVQ